MSTVSLSYPDVIRVRRVLATGPILILSSFVLTAITSLAIVISAANADLKDQVAVSQNSIAPLPVSVPTPPVASIRPIASETPSPSAGFASVPSVVVVPVPTPPSQ